MSQENVALSHRAGDAFNRRDLEAYLAIHDDDVRIFPLAGDMESSHGGHDGLRRWWADLIGAFPDITIEVVEIRDHGDTTVSAVIMHGHGAGGAAPVDARVWRVARFRHGKCVFWSSFRTESEALAAAGLSE